MTALSAVLDPDLGVNIVDLGFIRGVDLDGRSLALELTLTNRYCPLTSVIEDQITTALVGDGVVDDYALSWTFDPPWSPDQMSEAARAELEANGFSFGSDVVFTPGRRAKGGAG